MLIWRGCSQPSATYIRCGVVSHFFSLASIEFHWEVHATPPSVTPTVQPIQPVGVTSGVTRPRSCCIPTGIHGQWNTWSSRRYYELKSYTTRMPLTSFLLSRFAVSNLHPIHFHFLIQQLSGTGQTRQLWSCLLLLQWTDWWSFEQNQSLFKLSLKTMVSWFTSRNMPALTYGQ